MTFTIPQLVALAIAILILVLLARKYLPAGTVARVETAIDADIARAQTTVRADALLAVGKVETWLTDFSTETAMVAKGQAMIAAANASMKAKQELARSHANAMLAALPCAAASA